MGGYVREKYQGYILTDENFQILISIINKFFQEKTNDHIIEFTIYRIDSYYYVTENMDDILNEENNKIKKIIALKVCVKEKIDFLENPLKVDIDFSDPFAINSPINRKRTSDIYLSIEGKNRDNVYLLGEELKKHIDNEIVSISKIRKLLKTKNSFQFLFFGVIYIPIIFFLYNISDPEKIESLILFTFGFTVSYMSFIYDNCLLDKWILFGKEKRYYQDRKNLIEKIFWSMGIAFLMSFIASLIIKFFL